MNTKIIFTFLFLFVSCFQSAKALTVTASCEGSNYKLQGVASNSGLLYLWEVKKNGVAINAVYTQSQTYSKTIDLSVTGDGSYSITVVYLSQGVVKTENAEAIYLSNNISLLLPTSGNNTICLSAMDSMANYASNIPLYFSPNSLTKYMVNVYSTTNFGGAEGNLLYSITGSNPTEITLDLSSILLNQQYILVKIDCSNDCINATTKIVYYNYTNLPCNPRRMGFTSTTAEPKATNSIRFYPNPVEDILSIDGEISTVAKLEVYNSKGDLVETTTDFNSNEVQFTNKQAGIYLMKLYFLDGSVETTKINKR